MSKDYDWLIALPWVVKPEFVHGCNLKCPWCPVGIDKELRNPRKREFITLGLLRKLCRQYKQMRLRHAPHIDYGWPRIEIGARGEPLLHPNVLDCLATLRKGLPRCQVTMFSNGTQLLKQPKLLNQLYEAGLNILYLDCYNDTSGRFLKHCHRHADKSIEFLTPEEFAPYRKQPRGNTRRVISILAGIEDQEGSINVRLLDNTGGLSDPVALQKFGWKPPASLPLRKPCVRPFREFVLWCDGEVRVCCVDWYSSRVMSIGSLYRQTVEEVWYGARHLQVMRSLYKKKRNWGLCKTCDFFGGHRSGFLRNPFTGVDPLRTMSKKRKEKSPTESR